MDREWRIVKKAHLAAEMFVENEGLREDRWNIFISNADSR
jgi:hypothetical protein